MNPPSPTTATFLKPPIAVKREEEAGVKDEDDDEDMLIGASTASQDPAEALKDRNRRKQRLFRERQKMAIKNLEAQIKAVQGQVMGEGGK